MVRENDLAFSYAFCVDIPICYLAVLWQALDHIEGREPYSTNVDYHILLSVFNLVTKVTFQICYISEILSCSPSALSSYLSSILIMPLPLLVFCFSLFISCTPCLVFFFVFVSLVFYLTPCHDCRIVLSLTLSQATTA